MDTLVILAGVLGVGDLLLTRVWWRERRRRRKAERAADTYIRDNYRLMDALERKAALKRTGPVVVPLDASPGQIREAVDTLRARQTAQSGGIA